MKVEYPTTLYGDEVGTSNYGIFQKVPLADNLFTQVNTPPKSMSFVLTQWHGAWFIEAVELTIRPLREGDYTEFEVTATHRLDGAEYYPVFGQDAVGNRYWEYTTTLSVDAATRSPYDFLREVWAPIEAKIARTRRTLQYETNFAAIKRMLTPAKEGR